MAQPPKDTERDAKTLAEGTLDRHRGALEAVSRRRHARDVARCIERARSDLLRAIVEQGTTDDTALQGIAFRAVKNEAVDQVRAAARRDRLEDALHHEQGRRVLTPEEELERAELAASVNKALDTLTGKERLVVDHIREGGGYKDPPESITRDELPYLVKKVRDILTRRLDSVRAEFTPYLRRRTRGKGPVTIVLAWLAARRKAWAASLRRLRFGSPAVVGGFAVAIAVVLLLTRRFCTSANDNQVAVATTSGRSSLESMSAAHPRVSGGADAGRAPAKTAALASRTTLAAGSVRGDPRSEASGDFATNLPSSECADLDRNRYRSMAKAIRACLRTSSSMKTTVVRIGLNGAGLVPSHLNFATCDVPGLGMWNCTSVAGFFNLDDLANGGIGGVGYATADKDMKAWALPVYVDAGVMCTEPASGRRTVYVFESETVAIDRTGTNVVTRISAARSNSLVDVSHRFGFVTGKNQLDLEAVSLPARVHMFEPFNAPIFPPPNTVMFAVDVRAERVVRFILHDSLGLDVARGSLDVVRFNPVAIDRPNFMANLGNSRSAIVNVDDAGRCTSSPASRDDIPVER